MTKILHASTLYHEYWGGPKRYIRIAIHDSTEEFRKAAQKYSGKEYVGTDALACFQPSKVRLKINKDGSAILLTKHYAGIMRFSMEAFDTHIIVHECVHAAAHIYRLDCHSQVHLGDTCNYREEYLAHIVDDLFASVEYALKKANFQTIWKDL